MLTLANLRKLRLASSTTRIEIARIMGFRRDRLRNLELGHKEPWFDEAVRLARTFNLSGILPMIAVDRELTSRSLLGTLVDDPLPHDLELWRSGRRAPLSLALRIAWAFGLDDPLELDVGPLERQIWDMLESGDRHVEAPGWCPWCGVDRFPDADTGERAPHLDTCLPNNLWSPRDRVTEIAPLQPMVRRKRETGVIARGLKPPRRSARMTQVQVARALNLSPDYYAHIERGETPLTRDHAVRLAGMWGVTMESLYDGEPV